jgi:hypothetical protein
LLGKIKGKRRIAAALENNEDAAKINLGKKRYNDLHKVRRRFGSRIDKDLHFSEIP